MQPDTARDLNKDAMALRKHAAALDRHLHDLHLALSSSKASGNVKEGLAFACRQARVVSNRARDLEAGVKEATR